MSHARFKWKEAGPVVAAACEWLDVNWQYAGIVGGLFYSALLPLMQRSWTLPALLLWVQLPAYLIHQLEEHVHDRFRRYINLHLGHDEPILTRHATMVINVAGVWCVDFLALYCAAFHRSGFALLAFYLAIVNGGTHIAGAFASRAYNPGLVSAALLLMPFGVWGALTYSTAYALPARDHLTAVAFVIALHLGIISHLLRRREQLSRSSISP